MSVVLFVSIDRILQSILPSIFRPLNPPISQLLIAPIAQQVAARSRRRHGKARHGTARRGAARDETDKSTSPNKKKEGNARKTILAR